MGSANKWSRSTSIVAIMIRYALRHALLPSERKKATATTAGTRKCKTMCSIERETAFLTTVSQSSVHERTSLAGEYALTSFTPDRPEEFYALYRKIDVPGVPGIEFFARKDLRPPAIQGDTPP